MSGSVRGKVIVLLAGLASISLAPALAQMPGQPDRARTLASAPISAVPSSTPSPLAGARSIDVDALDLSSKRIRGLVMPLHHATISSRRAATLEKIGPDNGEKFAKGDVLVKFDCEVFEAELARAKAQSDAAEDAYRVKQTLARNGSVSKLQAVLARSEVKRAKAEVRVAEEKVSQCVIRAPFAGRVVRRIANAHETANFRDPLIEIVSDHDVEVRIFVPSRWLRTLKKGARFNFYVDETGKTVTAEIIAIGAWIDNVSQLLEIRAKVVKSEFELVAGMSGRAEFPDMR